MIDKNLTWYDYIHYISGKISKGVDILSKLKYMLPISGVVVRMLILDTKVDGSIPSINMFSP